MLEVINRLLTLQDCDRKIHQIDVELSNSGPERQARQEKADRAQRKLDETRNRLHKLENERQQLELDVESRKERIKKYSIQQYQTKKNDEYRALTHEIDSCKEAIVKLEDRQLELMEQAETVQKEVDAAAQEAKEVKQQVDTELAALSERQSTLKSHLEKLQSQREQLAEQVEESHRSRYDRLLRNKVGRVVVGIDHGVCGGCHMKLPTQVVILTKAQQDLTMCPNCGRILYYTRDMDMAHAE